MNQNLKAAISNVGKADALMYAVESCYLRLDCIPEDDEMAKRGVHAFYAVWDTIRALKENLEELSGDCRILDVLTAARDLHRETQMQTEQ